MSRLSLAVLLPVLVLPPCTVVAQQRVNKEVYGVGIVGNCCTHGAGLCAMFRSRGDTRVVAAFEANPRRARELEAVLGKPLARSYDAVIRDPAVDIVAVSCDPCDKADMVEKAASAGKAVLLNKPACDSLDAARRIAGAVRRHHVWLVHDIPMVRSVPVFARLLDESRARPLREDPRVSPPFRDELRPVVRSERHLARAARPSLQVGRRGDDQHGLLRNRLRCRLDGSPRAVTARWRKEWDVYRQADVEHFGQIILDYGDYYAFLDVGKQQLPGPSRHSNSMTVDFEHRALRIDASAEQVAVNHVPGRLGDLRSRREGGRLRRSTPRRAP